MPDYSQSEHLILDGYNLIHAFPELRKVLKDHGSSIARERLEEEVSCLHEPGRVRLTIVYDGQGGEVEVAQPLPNDPGFAIVYSPSGVSADEVIERFVTNSSTPERVLVATKDLAIAQTFATMGAFTLAPSDLRSRIDQILGERGRVLEQVRQATRREWPTNPFRNS